MGTPTPTAQPAKGVASLKTIVSPGNAATPADEANVQFTTSITDVRKTSDLSDYTGELEVRIPLQVTDRINYPPTGGQGPGTTTPFDLPSPSRARPPGTPRSAPAATSSPPPIRSCPAPSIESARAVWAMGQVDVYDGGPDYDADTQIRQLALPAPGRLRPVS